MWARTLLALASGGWRSEDVCVRERESERDRERESARERERRTGGQEGEKAKTYSKVSALVLVL